MCTRLAQQQEFSDIGQKQPGHDDEHPKQLRKKRVIEWMNISKITDVICACHGGDDLRERNVRDGRGHPKNCIRVHVAGRSVKKSDPVFAIRRHGA